MKCAIFGNNGMLGSYARSYLQEFYDILSFGRKDIDIFSCTKKEFFNFSQEKLKNVDVIINCAGAIKQRSVSDEEMITVNSIFPQWLAEIKKNTNCNVIHFTTDCVYSGLKGNYSEHDKHDCGDVYGKSKSLGENENLTIIRTSIIGEELRNKLSLLEWVKSNQNKTVNGFTNHFWNGVTCLELMKYVQGVINYNHFWNGVRNVFSPNVVSKYDLVNMISEVYELNVIVNKNSHSDFCDRSLTSIHIKKPITKSLVNQLIEIKNFKLT